MRVAVTGARGLLGRAIVMHLEQAGHQVIALSSSVTPNTTLLSGKTDSVIHWCAEQPWKETAAVLADADAVIHSAAHIPTNHKNPDEARTCFEVNALGTLNLLKASEKAGIKRFIFVSGANILKPLKRAVHENDMIGCEHAPYYLGSKVLAEIYVRSFQTTTIQPLIVRPSSIYGPNMVGGVLSLLAERCRTNQPLILKDGGRYQADYVWRDDVAKLLVKAVFSTQTGTVNLGSGVATSLLEVTHILCDLFGTDRSLIKLEPTSSRQTIAGFSAVNIQRAQRWFSYEPVLLRHGLALWWKPTQ